MARIPQQLIPLAILFTLLMVVFVAARRQFVPESFGDLGFYRADALKEISSQEPKYVGAETCGECHDDIYEIKANSYHKGVACEACHGAGYMHVDSPAENELLAPRERDYCPVCHGYNPSRPSGFPQIIATVHNPGKPCMSCHNPHNPTLPHTPEECSACHRSIANEKLVSNHTELPCTQCHQVPEEHRINPRLVRAEKPTSSATCGMCHAEDADGREGIPRVDMETHGERKVCWQCHYPHSPEGK